MTGMVIFNVALIAATVLVIAGGLAWAVVTQHRDHGVAAAGPLHRRRVWSRNRRAHAGSHRPLYVQAPHRVQPAPAA